MLTPWGDLPVSDAHLHFFSYRFFELLAAQKPGLTVESMGSLLGWEMPPRMPKELAQKWVSELDLYGIRRVSLIASLPGDESSVAAAVRAFPDRFHGYFLFNPRLPDAGERLEAAFSLGLQVPCLFPAMHHYSLADPCAIAVFQRTSHQPNPTVFAHCGVLSVGVRKKLLLPSPFDMRFSNPLDLHAAALRFPQVRFLIPHFGSGFFREALMLCDLCPNVYLDTSSSNSWLRYEPSVLDLAGAFRKVLAVTGPRRLLFGTDSSFFPRGWNHAIFEAQCQALAAAGVSEDDARLILSENLHQLFPLSL